MSSARRDTVKLKGMSNVVSGGTASLTGIPQGPTYHALFLVLGGTTFTKGHLTGIRVRLDGKLIRNISGADLDAINQYYNRKSSAQVLPIWFADPNYAPLDDAYTMGSIDTSLNYGKGFDIECDISASASAPTLDVWALRSNDQKAAYQGMLSVITSSTQNFASAAQFDAVVNTGSRGGALIRAAHFFTPNNAINQLTVYKDSELLIDRASLALLEYQQQELTRTIQTQMVVADFCVRNEVSDAVPTLRESGTPATFQFLVNLTAADTLRVYGDLWTTLDNV